MATSTTVQTINNDKLLKLGERFLNDYEKQKTRSLMYYKKMKNDPVFFQRRREQKQLFYQTIKTKLVKTGATAIKLMTNMKERSRRTEHITAKKQHLM